MVNIFITSHEPFVAARHMSDLLIPRMALESAEILCAVRWNKLLGLTTQTPSREVLADYPDLPPYRRSLGQRKHPCCLWAGEAPENYVWLFGHYYALIEEYAHRFPDRPALKCGDSVLVDSFKKTYRDFFEQDCKGLRVPDFTYAFSHEFPTRVLNKYRKAKDVSLLYRVSMTYKYLWVYTRQHKWTNRKPPKWLREGKYMDVIFKDPIFEGRRPMTATCGKTFPQLYSRYTPRNEN